MSWREKDLLDVENSSVDEIETVLDRAAHFRADLDGGADSGTPLDGHHVALLFAEPSTRTRLSFEIASRRLGAQTYLLDPPSSSMVKGETFADTVRNLDAIGLTTLVVRDHRAGSAAVAARYFGGHVVNAGDGWHAHPTQAMLDLFTLRRAWGGSSESVRGRKIVIVGDIVHSRVARSNIWTLTQAGADLWLCGPRPWIRGFDELARSLPSDRHLTVTDDLASGLAGADAVMGLRVQKERMSGGVSAADYVDRYQINLERLARTKPGAVYLHPGPINEGVEVTRGVARGPTSLVLEQARNGVPVRMAVLALLAEGSSAREPATRVVQDEAPVAAAPTPVARRQLPAARDVSSAKR